MERKVHKVIMVRKDLPARMAPLEATAPPAWKVFLVHQVLMELKGK
jgi:hypothetical protein